MTTGSSTNLKTISLVTLAIQNSFLILIMRFSRLQTPPYLSSTAVFMAELIKLFVSFGIYAREKQASGSSMIKLIFEVFEGDAWKLSIPAVLYTIQNNLQYLAVSNLEAATFQVTYQLKILTTAVISVLMLGKRLSWVQWLSLLLLTAGVALVQLPTGEDKKEIQGKDQTIGLISVFTACCLSGLAGVYFEKILKKNTNISSGALISKPPPSIWERNVQLAFYGSILALLFGVYMKDYEQVTSKGFFQGYNFVTLVVIATQALGGLIVAMVVKYADNILKGFATSISIIISCVVSVYLFDFVVTSNFIVGASLVIYSTYLYDSPPANGKKGEGFLGGWLPSLPFIKI